MTLIRHIVFFSIKRPEDAETVYAGLCVLKDIPHSRHIEVGRNLQTDTISADSPDFVVYAEFDTLEQLNHYKAHPLYARAIEIVRPLRDMRMAVDFLSD